MTFLEHVQNLTEPFTGGTSPSLDLITSIARAHSWILFLVNAVDVVGSSLLVMVSRFSRRFTSVSSSPVICSAFVLASLTLLVYVFNFFRQLYRERNDAKNGAGYFGHDGRTQSQKVG